MARGTGLWLLSAVTCLSVLHREVYARFDDSNSSVTLPKWRTSAEYITQCDFNDNLTPLCGWNAAGLLRTPSGEGEYHLVMDEAVMSPSGLGRLESEVLNGSEASCLEFWYHVPAGHNGTELRVLLRRADTDAGETQLWSSSAAEDTDAWRQEFLPLGQSGEMGMQVVFEMAQDLPEDGEVAIDKVGIRKGQCGVQCQDGTEFWTDEATRCVCRGGRLSCSPATCPEGHTCARSTSGPELSGTCVAHRKPRYTTFDGVNFRFVGPCTYILAKTCDEGASAQPLPFAVEAENEQRGNSSVSSVQQVNVDIKGVHLSMLRKEFKRVMVNGMWRRLPLRLSEGTVTVKRKGGMVIVETDFLLTVSYHASGEVRVAVPGQYSGKLCGMCGNFNHVKEDDFTRPDGSLAADADTLGQSWQSGSTRCEAPVLPSVCQGEEALQYAEEPYCGTILAADGPFAACSAALSAESFFASCVLDMCTTHGDPETLCDLLHTYASTCRQAGIAVPQWRNSTFCPLVCGANSHYNACASGCPEVCSSSDVAESCGGQCEERCECDPSFMLSAGRCVPARDCGCWVDGEHYEKGETFMAGRCDRLCQCMGQDNALCSASSCSADQVCKVRDGVMGCERSEPVTCSVYGDPHYITFDGKAYNFQGSCNYTLAKTCGSTPVQFSVTTRNQNAGRPTWSALESVALEVDGLHIAIRTGKRVYVNGAEVSLPMAPNAAINIVSDASYVHLRTNFGLSLLFDGEHRLFLQVDERYRGQMCGLCGTYSGSQFDDFVTPDGELLGRPDPFGNSWRVADIDWTCTDGSPVQPTCAPELQQQGFQECRKLFGDAFMACHMSVPPQIYVDSCVYDHCATAGDLDKLCASLESYVRACEINGVALGDWRKDTVCATATAIPIPTTTTTPSPAFCPLNCNFDTDECGWQQLVQDSFDWTRHSGPTPSAHSGPTSDHTTGSGYYMHLEGDGVVHGDSARMMSPACTVPGEHCLRFWYHMYGTSSLMALNVYQLADNKATKLWSKSSNQGDSWKEAKLNIKVSQPFQILLEAIRGSTELSDVALDDVSITYGECGGSSNTGIDPTTLPAVTNGNSGNPHPVCDLGCNFDSSLCSWHQLLTDSFDWTWQSGSTPTLMTGPSSDHTSGGGHYLYVEGDGVHNGDTARILSGECSDPGPQCLQFWYHIYGTADTMGLSVYLLEDRLAQGVWTKRNNQGDEWHKAEIDLMTTGPFQIILEGRRGTTELSDVAVDDIFLYRGSCADLVKPPVNPETPAPPVNPETPAPPVNPETPAPPVNPETPAPPVNPETPAPPVNPETPAPPVNPETPAPPVNPETPAPPVNPETPAPPVNPETPAPPVNPETPVPPVNPETPAPPVNPETPAPPVNPETPAPPVNPETPAPPVNPETPAPPVNPETPAPPVNPETPAPPVNPETPAPPVNPETPAPPVNPETPAPPVNPETPVPPVNPETPAPPVNPETPAPPVNPETPAPPVNPETPAPPVNPETPAPPVNPETPAPPVNPETPAPPVNPETPAPPVNPETPAPSVNPETPAPPVNPETPAPPVNPETPAPPVNPETPAPPVNPETPAPPVNPETPAPPTVKPTTSAPPTPSCPRNSHFTDCMPACQPTCKHLHGSPNCDTNEPCVGGCVCNDGFVLKDRVCVPIRKCGCQDNKGQNHYFDEVWYTDHCELKCECEEDDGEGHIECDDDECDGDDICYMDGEGEYTCKSSDFSECTIEEDPEYRTFDDMKHDFEGTHSYVLVQSIGLPKNLPDIYVEGINRIKNDQDWDSSEEDHRDDRDDSSEEDDSHDHGDSGFPRELKIRVYNHTVEFKKNRKLYVDGVRSHPPVSPTTGLKVLQRSSRIYLKTDFGFSVEFNGIGKTEIILPHTYKRRVGGLCGNFDGRKKNDMMKPDGSQAKRVKEFGESWRVTEERLNIRWRRSARRGLSRP
ncbi:zonadhesin-like [Sardina pilchardus]|uniref:zonadhesin-like n=1 Tax=Sardina pilchardus TaxID=27697 RepID=UPI002E0E581B